MCWYDDMGYLDSDDIENIKYDIRRKEREERELIHRIESEEADGEEPEE